MTQQYQIRLFQIPRWLAVVVGVLAIAFAVALFLLSLTLFLLFLPVIAIAGAVYYLFGFPRATRHTQRSATSEVIEGEYRVVEPERIKGDDARR